ncbi:MAG: hypothetical protein J2P26_10695 [Nocardiopsaceae bacterium]|nr:hypothetical protein [Nocardiopsaceae bacterium]
MALAKTIHAGPETLAEARAALRELVPDLAALVRGIPGPGTASIGTWEAAEVAAHLSHAFRADADALAGRPLPSATVTKAGMDDVTARLLAEDGERDPAALADRIGALAGEFDEVAARATADPVDWLQGARMAPSAVAGHLLEECLVHGHDIAKATGREWPIRRRHAVLAIEGGILPMVAALPPTAFVKPGSFRACLEMRLRGGGSTFMVFDGGSMTLGSEPRGEVDAHISACPAAILLTFMRRQGIAKGVLAGKLALWGRRPWKAAQMLSALSTP